MGGKASLILVLGFAIIFGVIGFRMNELETFAIDNMSYYHEITQSHNLASAGAHVGLSKLYQDPSLRGEIYNQSFASGSFIGGSVRARVDNFGSNKLRLRSESSYAGFSDTVEVYLLTQMRQSFSMYAWMTNFEGNVFWITGDTVWGRVHSNGQLHVNGRPVFWEKVTTARNFNPAPGVGTNRAIFKAGYETGVAAIQFPTNLAEIETAAVYGGRKYAGNVWVTLSPGTAAVGDGKVYVRTSETGTIIDSVALNDTTFNGAILSTGRLNVRGTLDGRLTLSSRSDIYVQDNVVYERNPLDGPTNDMLGLVADQNVIVANNAANNNNCEIHAAVFARAGSFAAEDFSSRPVSGTLRLVGGIIQNQRGAVGTFSGSRIRSGFSKRYRFDPRYGDPNQRPPYFPGFYMPTLKIASWWENVRIPRY